MITTVLRGCAIAIAIAGVIDPSITSVRSTRPEIAVVSAGPEDAELAERVERALARRFTIVRGPFSGASGTVLVGNRLPSMLDELPSPVFAVLPADGSATVELESVRAPGRAALDARVPIHARARVSSAQGRTLELTLRQGDVVIDRATRPITRDGVHDLPLIFVPTAPGALPLTVTASLGGAQRSADVDLLLDVGEDRWSVMFYDPRPSWQSTFVRRTIERDRRFMVTSRIVSAPNVSADAGRPPALDDLTATAWFDAIVVGAPEALTEREVAGLEAYMRRRGGSVLLLLDQRAAGTYDPLTSVAQWKTSSGTTTRITTADSAALRATELAWPAVLPAGAIPLGVDSAGRAILWRSAIGAGRLAVSGALDAWRFRDPAVSAFDQIWRHTIAELANAAPAPIALNLSSSILEPGEVTEIDVTLRDAALADPTHPIVATVSAAIEPAGAGRLRLWPDGIGRFRGSFRAPAQPGTYRVVVSSESGQASAQFVVAITVARATPAEEDLVKAWVTSRGGSALTASQIEDMPAALTRTLRPASRIETWHPMRSAWWIVPFALFLGAEWWSRRRRGLA